MRAFSEPPRKDLRRASPASFPAPFPAATPGPAPRHLLGTLAPPLPIQVPPREQLSPLEGSSNPKLPGRPSRSPLPAPLPQDTPGPSPPHSRPGPRSGQLPSRADVGGGRQGRRLASFLLTRAGAGYLRSPKSSGQQSPLVAQGGRGREREAEEEGWEGEGRGRRPATAPLRCSAPAHRATQRSAAWRWAEGAGSGRGDRAARYSEAWSGRIRGGRRQRGSSLSALRVFSSDGGRGKFRRWKP